MATRTLTVKMVGDHKNLDRAFKNAGGAARNFSKIAGAALLGVGTAVIGLGVKSVADFAKFDTGMREVFTLLPGVSQAAMDEMAEQVKTLSTDMGVLPNDVVPALYSALSAGVPQDNVFAFLETAQMAALGGVTDLNTAVDGISSVMNAFGDAVAGPAEASDLMFTAVRLGKTTFEELSASLFQVNPIAAALGVEFADVTAGLATMTAQGVPTSVATTQMSQLFIELSKNGGKAATAFEDMAGKSFQEFVGAGGNVAEALELMGEAATTNGVELQDMFGSVEAGKAALSLTSGDFAGAIEEMGNSAGATAAAYDTMNGGVARQMATLKAKFSVLMLDIGEKLAPLAIKAVDLLLTAFDKMVPIIENLTPKVKEIVKVVKDNLVEAFKTAVDFIKNELMPRFESFANWVKTNKVTVIAFAVGVGVAFAAWAISAGLAAAATLLAFLPFIALAAALGATSVALTLAWRNSETFRDVVTTAFNTVWDVVQSVIVPIGAAFADIGRAIKALFEGDWQAALDAGMSALSNFGTALWAWFSTLYIDIPIALGKLALEFIKWVGPMIPGLLLELGKLGVKLADWFFLDFIPGAVTALAKLAGEFIAWVVPMIPGLLVKLGKLALDVGVWFLTDFIPGVVTTLLDLAGKFVAWVAPMIPLLITELGTILVKLATWVVTDAVPAALSAGVSIAEGIIEGIGSLVSGAADKVAGFISGVGSGIADGFKSVWNTAATAINDFLPDKIAIRFFPDIDLPDNPLPLFLANGGIVTSPTLAVIGEAGPEAVVPLDKYNASITSNENPNQKSPAVGGDVHVHFDGPPPASPTEIGAAVIFKMRVAGL